MASSDATGRRNRTHDEHACLAGVCFGARQLFGKAETHEPCQLLGAPGSALPTICVRKYSIFGFACTSNWESWWFNMLLCYIHMPRALEIAETSYLCTCLLVLVDHVF